MGHTVLLALEALGLPDKPDSQKPMLPRLRTGVSVLKTYAGTSHSPQPEELNRLVVNVVQLSGSQSRENGPKPVIMAEDNPSGLPRPLIYVDQNILGAPLEALIQSEAFAAWRDTVVLVYSNETMNEIMRSEGLAPEFLGNLSKFVTARVFDELDDRLRLIAPMPIFLPPKWERCKGRGRASWTRLTCLRHSGSSSTSCMTLSSPWHPARSHQQPRPWQQISSQTAGR